MAFRIGHGAADRCTKLSIQVMTKGAADLLCQRTGTGAFEDFCGRVTPQLVRSAYLMTGSLADAEDLAQEVLTRAWQHWPRVSTLQHSDAWARRVLANLVVNRWRRRSIERRHSHAGAVSAVAPDPVSLDHLDILGGLARLGRRQREALVLHDVVGLTVPELAREMRVPEGTVRSWLHRSRRLLAEHLSAQRGDEGGTS